jgi:hypothetical protein
LTKGDSHEFVVLEIFRVPEWSAVGSHAQLITESTDPGCNADHMQQTPCIVSEWDLFGKRSWECQVHAMKIVRICPYCRTNNSNMGAKLSFQGA